MKIAVVTGASSGMGRETIIQLWEHFKGFDEIWIIARRRERLDELDRQVGVPLRKFALDLTRERDRDVLLRALSARKPQVKFLVNAAGFGMIGQVEELGLKSETDGASNQLQMADFHFNMDDLYKDTPAINDDPTILWDTMASNPH